MMDVSISSFFFYEVHNLQGEVWVILHSMSFWYVLLAGLVDIVDEV